MESVDTEISFQVSRYENIILVQAALQTDKSSTSGYAPKSVNTGNSAAVERRDWSKNGVGRRKRGVREKDESRVDS